jgi:hypothetical protein
MPSPDLRFRLLAVYAAVSTLLVGLGLGAWLRAGLSGTRVQRIQVERLELVEPDGTVRLVLASNARFPGIYFHGREVPHPDRSEGGTAGMIFLDADGTESGGLTFGGREQGDGGYERSGHLSFDQGGQDEMFTVVAWDSEGRRRSGVLIKDEPDWRLETLVGAAAGLDGGARSEAIARIMKGRPPMHVARAWLGRNPDRTSSLELADPEGRVRLRATVAEDGSPRLDFLDADGGVLRRVGP